MVIVQYFLFDHLRPKYIESSSRLNFWFMIYDIYCQYSVLLSDNLCFWYNWSILPVIWCHVVHVWFLLVTFLLIFIDTNWDLVLLMSLVYICIGYICWYLVLFDRHLLILAFLIEIYWYFLLFSAFWRYLLMFGSYWRQFLLVSIDTYWDLLFPMTLV